MRRGSSPRSRAIATRRAISRGAEPTARSSSAAAPTRSILRGGRNIDPVRIERALEDHPAVRRAAAFGVRNARVAGEQDIWTLVELDGTVAEADLRAHCSGTLGAALTPRRVVAVDALPLTADGAVRRHELSRLAALTTARSGAS